MDLKARIRLEMDWWGRGGGGQSNQSRHCRKPSTQAHLGVWESTVVCSHHKVSKATFMMVGKLKHHPPPPARQHNIRIDLIDITHMRGLETE